MGGCKLLIIIALIISITITIVNAQEIIISEIYYHNIVDDEYIELTIRDATGNPDIDSSTWVISTGLSGNNFSLPDVFDLGEFDYLSIKAGAGIDDLDASDGSATIYLNTGSEILDDSGDEVAFYDNQNLIDFVRYDGGFTGTVLGGWPVFDPGPIANTSLESVSIHGEDLDNSENWVSSPTSAEQPNIFATEIGTIKPIPVIYNNGANKQISTEGDRFHGSRAINFTTINRSAAVSLADIKIIQEMMNFSLNFYRKRGFIDPVTNPAGTINVTITRNNNFAASANPNGTMLIDIGGNLSLLHIAAQNKWTIEHEFYHLLTFNKFFLNGTISRSGTYDRQPIDTSTGRFFFFLDEGAAEYWGLEITKSQFNVTDLQVFNFSVFIRNNFPRFNSIPYNLTEIFRDFDFDLTSLRRGSPIYTDGFLFNKYIAETYGNQKLVHIFNVTRRSVNGTITSSDIIKEDSIVKAFRNESINITFADVWTNWRTWIYTTYKDNITFTNVKEFTGNGTKITESGSLRPWGTDYEKYNISTNIPFNITFEALPLGNYSVDIIIEYDNNTRTNITKKFVNGTALEAQIRNPKDINRIIVIKTKLDGAGLSFYQLNMTRLNNPPNITGVNPQFINGTINMTRIQNQTFTVNATDPENDTLTYTWFLNGTQIKFSSNTTHVNQSQPGFFNLTVIVKDPFNASDSRSWNISVKNRPPIIDNRTPSTTNVNMSIIGSRIFIVNATDPDNETLTFEFIQNGSRIQFSNNVLNLTKNQTGIHNLTVIIRDPLNASVSSTWLVNVTKPVRGQIKFNLTDLWNLISPIFNITGLRHVNITLIPGWNLIGNSGSNVINDNDFRISDGTQNYNLTTAQQAGLIQGTTFFFDGGSQTYKKLPGDTNDMLPGHGYWIRTLQDNLTLTLPGILGTFMDDSFIWMDAGIFNGTHEFTIQEAENAGLIQGTIYTYNTSSGVYDLIPADLEEANAYRGYWLFAHVDNLQLIMPV